MQTRDIKDYAPIIAISVEKYGQMNKEEKAVLIAQITSYREKCSNYYSTIMQRLDQIAEEYEKTCLPIIESAKGKTSLLTSIKNLIGLSEKKSNYAILKECLESAQQKKPETLEQLNALAQEMRAVVDSQNSIHEASAKLHQFQLKDEFNSILLNNLNKSLLVTKEAQSRFKIRHSLHKKNIDLLPESIQKWILKEEEKSLRSKIFELRKGEQKKHKLELK